MVRICDELAQTLHGELVGLGLADVEGDLMLEVLPVVGDRVGRTLTGQTVEAFYASVAHAEPLTMGLNCAYAAKGKALTDIRKYFNESWEVKQDKLVGLYKAENKETDRVCYIIGSYHPSFHSWHKDEYLGLLKERIITTRNMLHK